MTRMIERWFPSADVSDNSDRGWGSGNSEISLFMWFAKRPTAQAKAATVCSLLTWPDDPAEQKRLQDLVRTAMTGRYAAWRQLQTEIANANPLGASTLDPFSGRGMIPLESARLGVPAAALDYSPVAVLASHLLTSAPFQDWNSEPPLPFGDHSGQLSASRTDRLLHDLEALFAEIQVRHAATMSEFYPRHADRLPWGYLWAVTIPCQECGLRFPLIGSYELIPARGTRTAVAFRIDASREVGRWEAVVTPGKPTRSPTLTNAVVNGKKVAGKSAVCVFCGHVHPLAVHRRLLHQGHGQDALVLAADIDDRSQKTFRPPTVDEHAAAEKARKALASEPAFTPLLSAVPDEGIAPGNNNIIGPSIYGATTYGDFMVDRQTLSYVRLARIINDLGTELSAAGLSRDYVRALTGYAAAVVVKKLRRSTRGARFQSKGGAQVGDLFVNEGSITFSHDFFEAGIGDGPGTWTSISDNVLAACRNLFSDLRGVPTAVQRGSATALVYPDKSFAAVVTDPPYDQMIAYADASDLFFAWVKRCLHGTWPDLTVTADRHGGQDKSLEIIVKRVRGEAPDEHRTREHYDTLIAEAFREMRRVVRDDGVVTIVFGHGEPEVWQRLLRSIEQAGLVMTGSWPANTESGGQQGKANIETTLTMACRPAPADRATGRKGAVESEIKAEVKRRYPDWERWGLAPADMLMAAAGPAMEVVGRYNAVLDAKGGPVDIHTFLPLARAAAQDAMAFQINQQPLETFDARTRFALWWIQLYGRQTQAKSELRWQVLASSLELTAVRDLVPDADRGVRFIYSSDFATQVDTDSAVIDVALALAAASGEGLQVMGHVLAASGRSTDDTQLWAAIQFLADRLPDNDPDSIALTRVLRTKAGLSHAAATAAATADQRARQSRYEQAQLRLI
jgi:adenine-specific DNA methylase